MIARRIALIAVASLLVVPAGGAAATGAAVTGVPTAAASAASSAAASATDPAGPARPAPRRGPLTGRVIVLDPGHQLGNARHPRQINQLVPAGGFRKACNTTGTATNAGWPEATFAFRVATKLRVRLQRLGARVIMTRYRNSVRLWGPCVNVRGKLGNKGYRGRARAADAKVSIHGDGAYGGGRGFHVIVGSKGHRVRGTTRLGRTVRSALVRNGFGRADYIAGGDGYDVRGDLATLNLSRVPTVMAELGNMRSRRDARVMRSARGQQRYAIALTGGVRRFLTR